LVPVGANLVPTASSDETFDPAEDVESLIHTLDEQAAAVSQEIHDLEAQGQDATEAQARLDDLMDHKANLAGHPAGAAGESGGEAVLDGAASDGASASGLGGLFSEEPTLNFDNLKPEEKGAEVVPTHDDGPGDRQTADSQLSASVPVAGMGEDQPDSDLDTEKDDTKEAGALQAGDVLQDAGEGAVDDLLARQPEKTPIAVDDSTAGEDEKDTASDKAAKADEAEAPDSAALDSTLVDVPDDHNV
jgi:hypothetical protein